MNEEASNKRSLMERLQKKSRYVRLNSQTFEEETSFTFSPINIIIYLLFGAMLMVGVSFLLFAYTPLNGLIPNVPDSTSELEMIATDKKNMKEIERIKDKTDAQNRYNENLIAILKGETIESVDEVKANAPTDSTKNYGDIEFGTSKEDSILRARIEAEDKFSISNSAPSEDRDDKMKGVFFFTPLAGEITNSFGGEAGHHGIDIIAPENEAVKSTLDGTVIFAGWTTDNGHIIQIQHAHNLVSIYKHNSVLLKTEGDKVRAGDPIAIVGNTGDLSTGAHLHFELWYNGNPIDPQEFIAF